MQSKGIPAAHEMRLVRVLWVGGRKLLGQGQYVGEGLLKVQDLSRWQKGANVQIALLMQGLQLLWVECRAQSCPPAK